MSATSASVISALQSGDVYAAPVALKVEPDVTGASGGPLRLDVHLEGSDACSTPAGGGSGDDERQQQQQQLRDCLEPHVSDPARAKISKILEEVESLTEMEKLLLYLRLPNGCQNLDASLNGCPGVGGASNLHLSNQLEQSQAYTWIMSHLEEHASTCLRKDEVYDDYRSYCENHSMKSLNTADFGKVMKRAFPNVKPRRLGQRGQSKYCYGGLRKRIEVQPPFLPDLNPSSGDSAERQAGALGGSSSASGSSSSSGEQLVPPGESMLPECIVLVLEWVEKLLGRQFETLRGLAEYLVSNMYVNSRSCAAFALVADIHNGPTRQGVSAVRRSVSQDGRRHSIGAREETRTPSAENATKPLSGPGTFPTTPSARPSSRVSMSHAQTPPGPPITAYSAASVRRRIASPAAPQPSQDDPSTPFPPQPPPAFANASSAPAVKPNLLHLPPNIKDAFTQPQGTSASTTSAYPPPVGQPLRAFPPAAAAAAVAAYGMASTAGAYPVHPGIQQQPQPPAAHSQVPLQRYSGIGEAGGFGSSEYPPPPLQYGGGVYTPVHQRKRPYEATTQDHYSPYYNSASYVNDYSSPKRQRFTSVGESSTDYGAYYQQQQTQQQTMSGSYSQFASNQYDPYCGMGMLSPRASSNSQQHHPQQLPQQQQQHSQRQQQQQQSQRQQQQQQQLPRLGCSPGPYVHQQQRTSPFSGNGASSSALQSKLEPHHPVLPSLPKIPNGSSSNSGQRPNSRSFPRVGRTPSPVRFTSGPPAGPGLRRPSPLRSSPGQASSRASSGLASSPESGTSIQLPPIVASGAASTSASLQRSPGSPFRTLGAARKTVVGFRFTGEAGMTSDEQAVTSTVPTVAQEPVASSSNRRSADLHTPTPPTGCEPQDFLFEAAPGPSEERSSEPSPPSAFL